MIPVSLQELAAALDQPRSDLQGTVTGLCTDSRRVGAGDCFVALRGRRVDGSRFIPEALRRGAVVVVSGPRSPSGPRILRVEQPLEALGRIAALVRGRYTGPVLGITGSAGKTTVKELLRVLLPPRLAGVFPEASFNNAEGVPLTVARLEPESRVLVVELGTSAPGEIAALCRLARPTAGLLTSIGPGHLEGLGSVEGVLREKLALAEALPQGASLIINNEDPHLREASYPGGLRVVRAALHSGGGAVAPGPSTGPGRLDLGEGGPVLEHPFEAEVLVRNLWLAVLAARELGATREELVGAGRGLRPPPLRGEVVYRAGARLILDCYNANPLSMRAALEDLALRPHPRAAVLGEMLELGEAARAHHRELGARLAGTDPDWALFVGPSGSEVLAGAFEAGLGRSRLVACEDVEAARRELRGRLAPGQTVLVKGSRGVGLERLLEEAAGG